MPESQTVTPRGQRVAAAAPAGPQPGTEPHAARGDEERWIDQPDWDLDRLDDPRWAAAVAPLEDRGLQGRRTVTITGRGAEGYTARPQRSRSEAWPGQPSRTRRRQRAYERPGFKPDRAAMWAVLLCVLILLAAVASAHGAALPGHLTAHSVRP